MKGLLVLILVSGLQVLGAYSLPARRSAGDYRDQKNKHACRAVVMEPKEFHDKWSEPMLEWLRKREDEYDQNSGVGFVHNLTHTYAPFTEPCNAEVTCRISCEDVLDFKDEDEEVIAMLALRNIANAIDFKVMDRDVSQDAYSEVDRRSDEMIATFSDAKQQALSGKIDKATEKIGLHIFMGVLNIATAAMPFGGEFMALKKSAEIVYKAAKATATFVGTTGTAMTNVYLDTVKTEDFVAEYKANTATMMGNQQRAAIHLKIKVLDTLIQHGKTLEGGRLSDLIRTGHYLRPIDNNEEFNRRIRHAWTGAKIGTYWIMDRSWIEAAHAPHGCENDHRAAEITRICLPSKPYTVFYIYRLGREMEKREGENMVQFPRGLAHLTGNPAEWEGVTAQEMVLSSWTKYKYFGNAPLGPDDMAKMFALGEDGKSPMQEGGPLAGLVAIPIFFNPGGEAISSLTERRSRNFPCMAGSTAWDGSVSYNMTEQQEFLIATGLYQSKDFHDYCLHGMGTHRMPYTPAMPGMMCEEDKSKSFTFPNPKLAKIKHPIKRCRQLHPHEIKGYSNPGDLGKDPHHCGSYRPKSPGDCPKDDASHPTDSREEFAWEGGF